MIKKPYTSKEKTYISYYFFLNFTFAHSPTSRYVTILLYHIFLLITITYKYNKLCKDTVRNEPQ